MADYDPAHQSGAWDENGDYEVTDGSSNQENIPHHSTDQDQAEYSVDSAQHASGDVPSPDGATDDMGDYDPASVTAAPAPGTTLPAAADQVPIRPSPQRAAKQKPRTAGGFLVGDSDSEDDEAHEAPVPASSGYAPATALQTSVPHSPLQQNHITAKQASAAPSTADPAPKVNAALPAGQLENGDATPTPPTVSPVAVDRITQLESRVSEDSRGAMDAWLALINEYRSKNNIEQSRQIYDRFLAVFPQAVSLRNTSI